MFPEGRILDFLIVGVVALIVVGPKDLPVLMRRLGAFVARMRAMAAEFRASFDEMARQSELDELRAEVEALRTGRPLEAVTGLGETRRIFDDIDKSLQGGEAQLHPLMTHQSSPSSDRAAPPAPDSSPAPPAKPVSAKRASAKRPSGERPVARKAPAKRPPGSRKNKLEAPS
ncbi:MAG: Sec-independent protein translocase protein TatB [Caulobacteraceae bacterium]